MDNIEAVLKEFDEKYGRFTMTPQKSEFDRKMFFKKHDEQRSFFKDKLLEARIDELQNFGNGYMVSDKAFDWQHERIARLQAEREK